MPVNPFIKPDLNNTNPYTTNAQCPTCDGDLGDDRYAFSYLGEPITFCSRKCMNRWGQDNVRNWQTL